MVPESLQASLMNSPSEAYSEAQIADYLKRILNRNFEASFNGLKIHHFDSKFSSLNFRQKSFHFRIWPYWWENFRNTIRISFGTRSDFRIDLRHSTLLGQEAAKTLDEKKLQRLVDENIKGKQLDFVISHDLELWANTAGHTDNRICHILYVSQTYLGYLLWENVWNIVCHICHKDR